MQLRGSVLELKIPGFNLRILCLEGSVISLILPCSEGFLELNSLYVHKSQWHKRHLLFCYSLATWRCAAAVLVVRIMVKCVISLSYGVSMLEMHLLSYLIES